MDIGTRVGAIQQMDENTVHLFGYGKYLGDLEHPTFKFPNPCIELDSGDKVWGIECWWGPEDAVKEKIGDREVVIVKKEQATTDAAGKAE